MVCSERCGRSGGVLLLSVGWALPDDIPGVPCADCGGVDWGPPDDIPGGLRPYKGGGGANGSSSEENELLEDDDDEESCLLAGGTGVCSASGSSGVAAFTLGAVVAVGRVYGPDLLVRLWFLEDWGAPPSSEGGGGSSICMCCALLSSAAVGVAPRSM